nr:PREDICTED: uncharacterized protein LOC107982332 [Anolis carolinensis]|eukprot:XP_016846254.1 PREDICTED: uncharacterized protein LOC107982332 [Anolis carolinensis]
MAAARFLKRRGRKEGRKESRKAGCPLQRRKGREGGASALCPAFPSPSSPSQACKERDCKSRSRACILPGVCTTWKPGLQKTQKVGLLGFQIVSLNFHKEIQSKRSRDVDGVHGERGRTEWEQNWKHELEVQQQLRRVVPLLEKRLRETGKGEENKWKLIRKKANCRSCAAWIRGSKVLAAPLWCRFFPRSHSSSWLMLNLDTHKIAANDQKSALTASPLYCFRQ